jgi:hypothetical protein
MRDNSKNRVLLNIADIRALRLSLSIAIALLTLGLPVFLNAGAGIVTLDVSADTPSTAQLTITPSSVNFPNANPSTVPSIPATENPVSVSANAQIGSQSTATLTVVVGGDLISGSGDAIPIQNVSWTATGDGFVAGTLNRNNSVSAGSWAGPGQHSGTFSYFLVNSWSYATGIYSQTITYTLTAP